MLLTKASGTHAPSKERTKNGGGEILGKNCFFSLNRVLGGSRGFQETSLHKGDRGPKFGNQRLARQWQRSMSSLLKKTHWGSGKKANSGTKEKRAWRKMWVRCLQVVAREKLGVMGTRRSGSGSGFIGN